MQRVLIALERMVGRITTWWIAVSQADMAQGFRWRFFTKETVSLVRAGIDPEPFVKARGAVARQRVRSELGIGPSDLVIGTVACLKPQKEPENFVRVAALVAEELPQARFILAGDGVLRDRIDRLVRENLLSGRFHLLGWRRDIPELMSAMDVFVLTSRWEGLPCVLLEARAAAVPVVATDVGGAKEAIEEGIHGWLCPVGDTTAMARRVRAVIEDKQRGIEMSRPSETFPKEFTIAETVRQHQELYDRLLRRCSARLG
jgi:glycosyltransferase involved in cell wall biosynthesis